MHLSYIPQVLKKLNIHGSFVLPCWMTNPLSILDKENRVLVIQNLEDFPEDIVAAIINEKAVCNRTKTLLYSLNAGSVAVVKKLMEQLGEIEDMCKTDLRFSKDCGRLSDAVKALEKAPLFITDNVLTTSELKKNVRQVLESAENQRTRHRIVIVDDIISLKDMTTKGVIDSKKAVLLVKELSTIAKQFSVSFVLISRKPLKEIFSIKIIRPVYVAIGKKEYTLQTIMSE